MNADEDRKQQPVNNKLPFKMTVSERISNTHRNYVAVDLTPNKNCASSECTCVDHLTPHAPQPLQLWLRLEMMPYGDDSRRL
ncbi:jg15756 [Pararge aegeria aegeria]|uniref:Jg15756 protein n=1 Tax=Pararge aegeria aegeria TaxID=348720 RepID=A0A8S4RME5_9NEOP|nr:jg15756 [Pararge aegeria aegeria]